MEHVDFTQKKLDLHEEMETAIKNLMREKKVTVVDLGSGLEKFDTSWTIRRTNDGIEEVMVVAIKLDGDKLLYLDADTYFADGEWIPFDVSKDVIAATIDTVYDGVYNRLNAA